MKSTVLVAAVMAATLGFGTASFAEGPDWDGVGYPGTPAQQRQWEIQRQQRAELESQSSTQVPQYDGRWQRYDHGAYQRDGQYQQYGQYPRRDDHARGERHFRRGEYLARGDWEHARRVEDWRARHLAPPAPGYGWVQQDSGDYLLVALATGLIANVLLAR